MASPCSTTDDAVKVILMQYPKKQKNNVKMVKRMIIPTVWENIEAAIIFSSRQQQQQVPVVLQVGPALQLPLVCWQLP
jgi:hypothetical protein